MLCLQAVLCVLCCVVWRGCVCCFFQVVLVCAPGCLVRAQRCRAGSVGHKPPKGTQHAVRGATLNMQSEARDEVDGWWATMNDGGMMMTKHRVGDDE